MAEQEPEPYGATADGPYIAVAAFCERVLHEQDGAPSLIRVIDRITSNLSLVPPGQAPPPYQLTIYIVIKSGAARGSAEVQIRPEAPSGLRLPEIALTVHFEGEDRGIALELPIALPTSEAGLYWFDVAIDSRLLTRMPLRVIHQSRRLGAPTDQGS